MFEARSVLDTLEYIALDGSSQSTVSTRYMQWPIDAAFRKCSLSHTLVCISAPAPANAFSIYLCLRQ